MFGAAAGFQVVGFEELEIQLICLSRDRTEGSIRNILEVVHG
jgi:hypothetical protein